MLRINTSNGSTFKLDVDDPEQSEKIIELLSNEEFQKTITGITLLKRYSRKHRCTTPGCKRLSKLVCPKCGEINDNGQFSYLGNQFTISKPDGFDRISFDVEKISIENDEKNNGERLICYAGDIQIVITTYSQQPSSKIILRKIGKRRYSPNKSNCLKGKTSK